MEYGLGHGVKIFRANQCKVLILVLMEYGLGLHGKCSNGHRRHSLNTCFNGIWSRTATV